MLIRSRIANVTHSTNRIYLYLSEDRDYSSSWRLLHMEREYIACHIVRRNSGQEHLIASTQPRKYSEDYSRRSRDSKPKQWIPKALEGTRWTPSEVLNACTTRLRRARGLVGPGTAGLPTGTEYSRVGNSAWTRPTSFCIYPNRSRTSRRTRELAESLGLDS